MSALRGSARTSRRMVVRCGSLRGRGEKGAGRRGPRRGLCLGGRGQATRRRRPRARRNPPGACEDPPRGQRAESGRGREGPARRACRGRTCRGASATLGVFQAPSPPSAGVVVIRLKPSQIGLGRISLPSRGQKVDELLGGELCMPRASVRVGAFVGTPGGHALPGVDFRRGWGPNLT